MGVIQAYGHTRWGRPLIDFKFKIRLGGGSIFLSCELSTGRHHDKAFRRVCRDRRRNDTPRAVARKA